MMLALVVYCYANGIFGSRRVERATYRDVAVRYLTGDTQQARRRLEQRARQRAEAEQDEYQRKLKARAQRQGRRKGGKIKPPDDRPRPDEQTNLTDSSSRLMRKNKRSGYEQCFNAQATVDTEGSQLVLSARVTPCASDRNELAANVATS